MNVTEKEALEKGCPHARVVMDGAGCIPNRRIESGDMTLCIGSRCMAWRWAGWHDANGTLKDYEGDALNALPPGTAVHVGYCGMAGKP